MNTRRKQIRVMFLAVSALAFHVYAQSEALPQRVAELEKKVEQLETTAGTSLRGYWKNGFILEQPDKAFSLQLGGRFQLDSAFFSADEELEEAKGEFDDGTKIRRAYLFTRGKIYDNLSFVMEYDFAGGVGFQNLYMSVAKVPVLGNVLVGQTLEPMGLEENSSNNHITFLERGFTSAFNPIYNVGVMSFDNALDQRVRWAAGVFKDTDNFGASTSNEEFSVTARLTGLPYLSKDEKEYIHLGSSMSYRNTEDTGYRLRARPESFLAPYVVDTKAMDADTVNLAALEAAIMFKSVFIQGEWSMASVDLNPTEERSSANDQEFTAYYVMASYFLTGEYRPYAKNSATIGRVTPQQNATGKNWGAGAWEIAVRFNTIDLLEDSINGGEMDATTLGLNWYLNPHARLMWDYSMAEVKEVGDVDVFAMRFAFDF